MDDLKAKQQVIEKIKSSANILVTVSDNPTVDALSAAIGLTLLFDKLGKYGTAIFSGVTPPAIKFLEPEKVLDSTTDSLRDFIIALDKEKADHLRYKVEGDAVKIFITPYKTTITSQDLEFSQGDYNVELVIALGVDDQDHLDKALEAHGQIFHDAAVITITANDQTSTLGGIDWHDSKASSLSEMITALAESLKTEKTKSLIDAPIATAFMTGLVAQTERFSNRYTSPQSLTVASSLMAAGADQQLIATKLQEAAQAEAEPTPVQQEAPSAEEEVPVEPQSDVEEDGTLRIIEHTPREKAKPIVVTAPKEDSATEPEQVQEPAPAEEEPAAPEPTEEPVAQDVAEEPEVTEPADDFSVSHETLADLDRRVKSAEQKEAAAAAYDALNQAEKAKKDTPKEGIDALIVDDEIAPTPRDPIAGEASDVLLPPPIKTGVEEMMIEPSMGGTLSATAEQAADDKRREEEKDRNKTLLSHGGAEAEAAAAASVPAFTQPAPIMPPSPLDLGLPLPPPLPDFSNGGPSLVGPYAAPAAQPEILGDILTPDTQANSSYFTPPAAEGDNQNYFSAPNSAPVPQPPVDQPPAAPTTNNPGQFKIPGQQ